MDMEEIICGCLNVTRGDIKKAIDNGAKSFEEVQAITKAGTGCGNCIEDVKNVVNELLEQQNQNTRK